LLQAEIKDSRTFPRLPVGKGLAGLLLSFAHPQNRNSQHSPANTALTEGGMINYSRRMAFWPFCLRFSWWRTPSPVTKSTTLCQWLCYCF